MNKIITIMALLFNTLFCDDIKLILISGITVEGEFFKYTETEIFVKNKQYNRIMEYNYIKIDTLIFKDYLLAEVNKESVNEIFIDIERKEKIKEDEKLKEKEKLKQKKLAEEQRKQDILEQKKIEEKEELEKQINLLNAGKFGAFIACPHCGTINFGKNVSCTNCDRFLSDDIEVKFKKDTESLIVQLNEKNEKLSSKLKYVGVLSSLGMLVWGVFDFINRIDHIGDINDQNDANKDIWVSSGLNEDDYEEMKAPFLTKFGFAIDVGLIGSGIAILSISTK
jgi:hypothetical protein